MAGTKSQQGTLAIPTPRAATERGGPVYQGVCKQIRALFPTGPEAGHKARCKCDECLETAARQDAVAGWIAQARSLAASIDRVSGHGQTRQASGVQLGALHERLEGILERLAPDGDQRDPFEDLLEDLANLDDQETTSGDAAASHPAQ